MNSEFRDVTIAHAAALLTGRVVFFKAGTDTSLVFGELRRRYGLVTS
jgi:hypothetical protein